jgi:hypothetical protein
MRGFVEKRKVAAIRRIGWNSAIAEVRFAKEVGLLCAGYWTPVSKLPERLLSEKA